MHNQLISLATVVALDMPGALASIASSKGMPVCSRVASGMTVLGPSDVIYIDLHLFLLTVFSVMSCESNIAVYEIYQKLLECVCVQVVQYRLNIESQSSKNFWIVSFILASFDCMLALLAPTITVSTYHQVFLR